MDRVLVETLEDGVLTLTLNRPDRLNALNREMIEALAASITRAAGDSAVGAVVLAGAGRAFCSGGDVKGMAERNLRPMNFDERVQDLRRRMDVARLLHEMPKPAVAMLRGAVAGAGLSLALACDLRIAGDALKLTTAFAKVGLSGDFGGSWFLTRLVGPAKARELYFTSPVLGAAEALALGLVNRVVADSELESATRALARSLAAGPRVTLGYMKQNMTLAEDAGLSELMDAEALRHTRCAETEDHREAVAAFVEKRAPVFRGR
jgi:2-(1,2-epoxy-1,2-dihydrophenyl)acetyl-CoA isomerase